MFLIEIIGQFGGQFASSREDWDVDDDDCWDQDCMVTPSSSSCSWLGQHSPVGVALVDYGWAKKFFSKKDFNVEWRPWMNSLELGTIF